jgi:protein phosphatase PTC7
VFLSAFAVFAALGQKQAALGVDARTVLNRFGQKADAYSAAARARGRTAPSPTTRLQLMFAAANIPHPEKADKGGEDAFFAQEATGSFGVADGVGGSATDTVDPGVFSRTLLRHCQSKVHSGLEPAINAAYDKLTERPVQGSSTLLLGKLEPCGELNILNLGDSGLMVLRPGMRSFRKGVHSAWPRIVFRSSEQTHYFNCPFQVSSAQLDQFLAEVDNLSVQTEVGDIIIAATDGVFDNMHDWQIQNVVARHTQAILAGGATELTELADAIAEAAQTVGRVQNERLDTPFTSEAAREGFAYRGGKMDDIAIVCGLVTDSGKPTRGFLNNF